MEAVRQLEGEGLSKSEAEAQRDTLIQGYRWILVDEYQDIGPEEYQLISAIAGRSLDDADLKLSLFAVGDDDQNIYAFNGASVGFIRKFEEDYKARPAFLVENYRSTHHIIAASNAVISAAPDRMKLDHEIRINADRRRDPEGGVLAQADSVGQGRVQLLNVPAGDGPQAIAAVDEMIRVSKLDPDWSWARTAIISRDWKRLGAVRTYAEKQGIKVEMANQDLPNIWRLRETQALVASLRRRQGELLGVADIIDLLNEQSGNKWVDLLAEGIAELAKELKTKTMPVPDIIEWLAEWSRETRGEQRGLLLLTAHRAKGLEFDHVAILDGGWDRASKKEDRDAPRRLFYVAMTRAKKSLIVMTAGEHALLKPGSSSVVERQLRPLSPAAGLSSKVYHLPNLKHSDLSYAGRQGDRNEVHRAIKECRVGDPLHLNYQAPNWELLDRHGRLLGRMSKAWEHPPGQVLLSGAVGAVVQWRKSDGDEQYAHYARRDDWETVLPELVFALPGQGFPAETLADKAVGSVVVQANPADCSEAGAAQFVTTAKSDNLAALGALVQRIYSESGSWEEFIASFKERGFAVALKGEGLVLKDGTDGRELCKMSALGLSYKAMVQGFEEGFPGHRPMNSDSRITHA